MNKPSNAAQMLADRLKDPVLTATGAFRRAMDKRLGRFGEAALASATINILTLVTSFFAMQVYDRVVPNNATDTLLVLLTGVVIAVVLELALKIIRTQLLDLVGKNIEMELSQLFFNKALTIRMDARPNTVGTFASQVREFESVKNILTSTTLFAIADAPFALLFLFVIFLIGGWIGLVALAALPLTMLVGWVVQKPLAALSQLHMRESSVKNGMLIEAIDGAESIKATGGEGWFSQRWYNLSLLIAQAGLQTRFIANLAGTIANSIQQLCYALTVVAGVYAIGSGQMTMGALIACTILVSRVLSPVTQLASMAVSWHHAGEALKALNELMKRPDVGPAENEPAVRLSRFKPELRLENIHVVYGQDEVSALKVPDLEIPAGQRVAIVGPTGSGKSTLLKSLTGLYKPAQGRCFASGIDMQLMDPVALRHEIGYLPQDVRLFNGTIKDNLCLGIKVPDDDALLAACALTGLDTMITKHPRGLGLPIFEGGRGLSGGQRQMVGLARVLLQRPAVLLLDEPTASLDTTSERRLIRQMADYISREQTLVVVTHKMAILELVERVIVVDQGAIVLDGPRDAVLARLSGQPTAGQQEASA